LHSGETANTGWYTISNDWHNIQTIWNSGDATTADLFIDGELVETLVDLNTSTLSLDAVRLGPSAGTIGNGASGSMYFDAFESYLEILVGDGVPDLEPMGYKNYLPLILMQALP
jgi:hypothetical protein